MVCMSPDSYWNVQYYESTNEKAEAYAINKVVMSFFFLLAKPVLLYCQAIYCRYILAKHRIYTARHFGWHLHACAVGSSAQIHILASLASRSLYLSFDVRWLINLVGCCGGNLSWLPRRLPTRSQFKPANTQTLYVEVILVRGEAPRRAWEVTVWLLTRRKLFKKTSFAVPVHSQECVRHSLAVDLKGRADRASVAVQMHWKDGTLTRRERALPQGQCWHLHIC